MYRLAAESRGEPPPRPNGQTARRLMEMAAAAKGEPPPMTEDEIFAALAEAAEQARAEQREPAGPRVPLQL